MVIADNDIAILGWLFFFESVVVDVDVDVDVDVLYEVVVDR